MSEQAVKFEEDPPRVAMKANAHEADALLLDIDGYEGPINVLLEFVISEASSNNVGINFMCENSLTMVKK